MRLRVSTFPVVICILSLSILSCGGERREASSDAGFIEADLRSLSPGGPIEKGTAVLKGQSHDVFIQKANSQVYYDLDVKGRGAFYMKLCGKPCEQGEPGAVKFDVIVNEKTGKPFTLYGGFLIPAAALEDVQDFLGIVLDISKFKDQKIDLTMRLVGDKNAILGWTQPEFRPFPGQPVRN